MARDKTIQGRAEPAQRRQAGNPAEPGQPWQHPEQRQPGFKAPQPFSLRSAQMHLLVKIGAREESLCRYSGIVII